MILFTIKEIINHYLKNAFPNESERNIRKKNLDYC